jgi:N-acetylglutamate synthase-like GNAT family acetyltransferase
MDDPLGQRSVRRAKWSDAEKIAALLSRAGLSGQLTGDKEMDVTEVLQLMASGEFLVLDHHTGGLAAVVYVEVDAHRGRLSRLAVDPPLAWSDLGLRLVTVAELLCQARGCQLVELAVTQSLAELPPLYRSLGYRERGPVMPLDVGTIVMSKALAG